MPIRYAILGIALLVALHLVSIGYLLGRNSHQNVNELQRAGFVVLDPDGYECSKFDEGINTALPFYWFGAEHK